MQVIPAVDIRGGRCVRLAQGDYARETVFEEDPVVAARRWADLGAERIHVVDLDGARDGRQANAAIVHAIARSVGIGLRGIHDDDTAELRVEPRAPVEGAMRRGSPVEVRTRRVQGEAHGL